METLDKCFENVCELDLIFHIDKVRILWYHMSCSLIMLKTGALYLARDCNGRYGARDEYE